MAKVTCPQCGTDFDSREKACPNCGVKNNLKVCHVCGAQMAKGAKRCPKCGAKNRKPIYKRWWFWALAICAIFVFWNKLSARLETSEDVSSDVSQSQVQNQVQSQAQNEQDVIVGTWYPFRYVDQSAGVIKDATPLGEITVRDDHTLDFAMPETTYHWTWSATKEDKDGYYYKFDAGDGESISAAYLPENSGFFADEEMKEYRDSLVILLGDDTLICKRENIEGGIEQSSEDSVTSSAAALSMSQQNAIEKACDYLDYTAFSYTGLIEQLKFEGFSDSDATYAADHCGADWDVQAARKAQEYLAYSSFSRSELIDQLKFEGFTDSQAVYGVTQNGY